MNKYGYILIVIIFVLAGLGFYYMNKQDIPVTVNETPVLNEKEIVKKYVEDNIKTLVPEKSVLGGSWYTTSVEIDLIAKTGKASYEDGHIAGKIIFDYLFEDGLVLISGINGRYCYEYNHKATTTDPYTVKEKIDITRVGKNVTGIKSGTQAGPDMTNGYTGTLVGDVGEDTMDLLFSYVIEGSSQKEKELYNIMDDSLVKFRYVLKEEKGVLVPDFNSTPKEIVYLKVSCSSI